MNRPTPGAPDLSNADLWHGGFLEAAIVLGRRDDPGANERLVSALRTVWSNEMIFGPYVDRFDFGPDSAPITNISAASIDLQNPGRLYGWIKLPSGDWSVGGTDVIRQEFGDPNLDWLDVHLPLGGLTEIDDRVGGYPFGDIATCRDWLEPVSARLGAIGSAVLGAVGGVVAFVGFEVSGTSEADGWNGTVPSKRSIGYVTLNDGGVTEYHAPTEWR